MEMLGCIAEVVPASSAGFVMAAVYGVCVVLSRCSSGIFEIDDKKKGCCCGDEWTARKKERVME
jgi:hypothetical protein